MFFEQAREQAEQDFQADDKNAQVLQLCAELPSVKTLPGRSCIRLQFTVIAG